jgi:Conjugal transfer protein TraD
MSSNGNGNGNDSGHSREQGLRVHHLANLGGLVALAGLDHEPPDFLLGALLSAAHEASRLTAEQRARVASIGRSKLDERATGKRAWKSWSRAQDLHAITLSTAQVEEIIQALGGEVPADPTLLALVLSEVLSEACNGAA